MQYNEADLHTILNSDFLLNPEVFKPGRRNDDAVDLCCICRCLNLDPNMVFGAIRIRHQWNTKQYQKAREHMNRVMDYYENWGTPGTMEAMQYSINY